MRGVAGPSAKAAGQHIPPGSRLPACNLLEAAQDRFPAEWPVLGTGGAPEGDAECREETGGKAGS